MPAVRTETLIRKTSDTASSMTLNLKSFKYGAKAESDDASGTGETEEECEYNGSTTSKRADPVDLAFQSMRVLSSCELC